LFESLLGVGPDRLGGAFGLANATINAFVRVNDEHVLALIETVDRTDFDAIHVFALDAIFQDHIGH
jgi:hypothetical protein